VDVNTDLKRKHFIFVGEIESNSIQMFIGEKWQPECEIYIVGAVGILLNHTCNQAELYLAISKNPDISPEKPFFQSIKTDWLFYFQKDQRFPPIGQKDLVNYVFLPPGTGFYVDKGEPIYFKCCAVNRSERTICYDIISCIYYVEIMSALHVIPQKYTKPKRVEKLPAHDAALKADPL